MVEDPSGIDREPGPAEARDAQDPERTLESGDDPVREEEAPPSIDVQPEDPRHPGAESPEPIDQPRVTRLHAAAVGTPATRV